MVVRKENYAMRKLAVPERVTLPNGRTFVACYERIHRRDLPPIIRMQRTYRQRAAPRNRRRVVCGQGIVSTVKKVLSNPTVRALAKKVSNMHQVSTTILQKELRIKKHKKSLTRI